MSGESPHTHTHTHIHTHTERGREGGRERERERERHTHAFVSPVVSPCVQGPIHAVADLEPICCMCQENPGTVTLKPCDHKVCTGMWCGVCVCVCGVCVWCVCGVCVWCVCVCPCLHQGV